MTNAHRLIRLLLFAVIASATPLAMTNAQGPRMNQARAASDGYTCCASFGTCQTPEGQFIPGFSLSESMGCI